MRPGGFLVRVCFMIAAAASLALQACTPAAVPKTVSLRIEGGPPEAAVTVDDVFIGRFSMVASRGVALPVGSHRVSIEAPGYFPWDKVVEARSSRVPIRLSVNLVAIPD